MTLPQVSKWSTMHRELMFKIPDLRSMNWRTFLGIEDIWPTVPSLDNWLPGNLSSSPLKELAHHLSSWPGIGLIEQTEKELHLIALRLWLWFYVGTGILQKYKLYLRARGLRYRKFIHKSCNMILFNTYLSPLKLKFCEYPYCCKSLKECQVFTRNEFPRPQKGDE